MANAVGPFANLHGMAASPILARQLIMICDQDSESICWR
jgi:hypothetical protein